MLVIIAGGFFQEAAGKKKEFGESVWKMIHLYSGTPEGWKNELPSTAKGNFTCEVERR